MRLRALRSFVFKAPSGVRSIRSGELFEADEKTAADLLKASYAVKCTPENESSTPESESSTPESESIPEECIESETISEPEPEQEIPKSAKKKRKVKLDEAESSTAE